MLALELFRTANHSFAEWLASPGVLSAQITATTFASQFGLLALGSVLFCMAYLRGRSSH